MKIIYICVVLYIYSKYIRHGQQTLNERPNGKHLAARVSISQVGSLILANDFTFLKYTPRIFIHSPNFNHLQIHEYVRLYSNDTGDTFRPEETL